MKNNKKKIIFFLGGGGSVIALLLSFAIMMTFVGGTVVDESSESSSNDYGSGQIEDLIAAANDEYNTINGSTDSSVGLKYRRFITPSTNDSTNWCASFVSFCANKANIPLATSSTEGIILKTASCQSMYEFFNKMNLTYKSKAHGGNYTPVRGDLIVYSREKKYGTRNHIGIVESVENSVVFTIEGNSSKTIKKNHYSLDNAYIVDYLTPNYQESVVSNIGSLSAEFKYFAKYESGQNYDQGFSKSDEYHALGYYQFDNRYDLQPFLNYCFVSNNQKYSMFYNYLYVSKSSLANNKGLESAWHQAYRNDANDFANKQDQFEYNTNYIPVENYLKSKGINISSRRDCIKGLCLGVYNLFGAGGSKKFFNSCNNSMSDSQLAITVCDSIINYYQSHPSTYSKGYINRYRSEKAQVLDFLK